MAAAVEDTGYETARVKLLDAIGTVTMMLRQRGLDVTHLCNEPLDPEHVMRSQPPHLPMTEVHARLFAQQWSRLESKQREDQELFVCVPVVSARIPEGTLAPSTAAALHVERGLATKGDATWVYMINSGKFSIKHVRRLQKDVEKEVADRQLRNVILITRERVTMQAMEGMKGLRVRVETFMLNELVYNITQHSLVPKHRIAGMAEIAALVKKYTKLAQQDRGDPISRYYGLETGDVVVYTRRRSRAMGGAYYRMIC